MMAWDDGTAWGDTVADVERTISAWIADAVAAYEPEVVEPAGTDTDAKWLASSGLQKAIRRGLPDTAKVMAETLRRVDPDYFWRRGRVIVLEDIGVANLPLTAAFLWVAGKVQWRRRVATDRAWMQWFVDQMANSVKDRSADDLNLVGTADPTFAPHARAIAFSSAHEQHQTLAHSTSLREQVAAVQALSGRYPVDQLIGGTDTKIPGSMDGLCDALRDILGVPAIVELIVRAGRRQYTPFHLTLPLVWSLAATSPVVCVRARSLETPFCGAWPTPALDIHTASGKKAIAYHAKACGELRDFLETHLPEPQRRNALGAAIFRAEGVMCDRRIQFEGAADIEETAGRNLMAGQGNPPDHLDRVDNLVRRHLDGLNGIRRRILARNKATAETSGTGQLGLGV